jgi:hypothetical protein
MLARNPFLWLVSRDRLKPAYAWLFLVSMIGVWFWGYAQNREIMFDFYPLVPTVIMIHTFLKIWVVSEVSYRMVEDQRNGALELLLSTPLTHDDIFTGQKMALLRQFARPVLVLCALELVAFHRAYPLGVILAVQGILVADLLTLTWVSTRLSLNARSINEVFLKSSLWVLLAPFVAFLAAWPLWASLWAYLFPVPWLSQFQQRVYLWFVVGLTADVLWIACWARPDLLRQARDLAVRRLNSVAGFARRCWSWRLTPEA